MIFEALLCGKSVILRQERYENVEWGNGWVLFVIGCEIEKKKQSIV